MSSAGLAASTFPLNVRVTGRLRIAGPFGCAPKQNNWAPDDAWIVLPSLLQNSLLVVGTLAALAGRPRNTTALVKAATKVRATTTLRMLLLFTNRFIKNIS